jgi:uncharacterized coiled-coil DUF342 family protein
MFVEITESVEKFEKFTKLVSERFDIKVAFDGVKAQTDGNIITLPNILAMSDKEIEFLYGILLHEIGHVKFSQFEKAMFAMIKSHNHFCVINAIEDARIENKMMGVYEGASNVFEQLYNEFSCDKEYMAKIFKHSGGETDLWFAFSMYVHNYLVKIDVNDKSVIGKKRKEVEEMFAEVKKTIDNTKLLNTADAHGLGTKLYDHFFNKEVDKSEKLEFAKEEQSVEKGKEEIKKLLDQLRELNDLASKIRKDVKGLRDTKKDKGKELNQFQKEHSKELEEAQKEAFEANDVMWDRKRLEQAQNDLNKLLEEIAQLEQKINDLSSKMQQREQITEKLKENLDKLTPSKKAVADKSIKSNERMNKNAQPKLAELQEKIKQMKEALEHAKNRVDNWKDEVEKNKNMTEEEIKQQLEQANKKLDPIYKQEGEYNKEIGDLKNKIAQKMQDIKNMMEGNKGERMKAIEGLDKLLKESGIEGAGIVPSFEESDWKEADNIQQGFDKDATAKTGMPVVNGMSPFGTNVRDIIMKLEDVSDKLDNIDLAKLFAKKVRVSSMESLNDIETEQDNTDDEKENVEALSSVRRHIPVSTAYDVVREAIGGGDMKPILKVRSDKAQDITKLTNTIRTKFRFKQKPRFLGAQEEGTIDSREIWRVPTSQGKRIFEINQKKIDNKVQVAVAVDISGSMDKEQSEYGEKITELCVMLSDALENCHVKHEVIGFGAPVDDNVASLGGLSSVFNRTRHRIEAVVFRTLNGGFGIQNLALETWDNADGESLRVIGKRLLKQRGKKKVMFVITDGKPFLNDADIATLDQDLKNTLVWAKRNEIEIYALGFNDTPKEFYGDRYCKVENMDSLTKFLQEKLIVVQ